MKTEKIVLFVDRNVWGVVVLAALLTISAQPAAALNDSIPDKHYKNVRVFGNECDVVIPKQFKKLRKKRLDHPYPYLATERSGFKGKNGSVIKFYCTSEVFPNDKQGIAVWDVLESLSAHIEKKKFLEGGYVVVDRKKTKNKHERNLYFIKYQYISDRKDTEYMLSLCLEYKGKILIGFLTSPHIEFIETYQDILYQSLQFETKGENQPGKHNRRN